MHRSLRYFLVYMRSLFIRGLFALLPLALTVSILHFTFGMIKRWLGPVQLFMPAFLQHIPHAEFIIVIVLIFIMGIIVRSFFVNMLMHYVEGIVTGIPMIKPIYASVKQIVQSFSPQEDSAFKKVVLLNFPDDRVYSIGFLNGPVPYTLAPHVQEKLYSIFVPASPNPTSGVYIMVPERLFTVLHITRQEAMSIIVSGGIIMPERLFNHHVQNGEEKMS